MSKKIEELKPIDTTKYKITKTGQVIKMTEKDLRKQATSTVEWENTPVLDRPLFVHAYITGAKSSESRIEELEKENTQLRLKLDALEGQTPWQDIKDKSEVIGQLTKAKELLRKFLDSKSIEEKCVAESEADKFLNSEAKESCPDCFCENCTKEDYEIKELGWSLFTNRFSC